MFRNWQKVGLVNGNTVTIFCGNDSKHSTYEQIDGIDIFAEVVLIQCISLHFFIIF